MKHDLRDYVPDIGRVLKEYAPEAVRERRRKALEKLQNDGPLDRVSKPSPWAQGTADEVDKAALPSATAPKVEEQAVITAAPALAAGVVPVWQSWRVVAACATVGAMVLLAAVLVQMGRAPQVKADATGAIVAGASASGRGPGVMMTAAAPSVTATADPGPEPRATASTSAAPSAPSGLKPRGKPGGTSADPHDAAPPTPPMTAAPQMTAAPSSLPSVAEPKPSAPAPATDDDSFMRKRHQ